MLEDQSLGLLSCLVVDELHMVGEEERGYQLELLLTKLRWGARLRAGVGACVGGAAAAAVAVRVGDGGTARHQWAGFAASKHATELARQSCQHAADLSAGA
jgi:Lhr-like helicase